LSPPNGPVQSSDTTHASTQTLLFSKKLCGQAGRACPSMSMEIDIQLSTVSDSIA
jgi:hypothetical protein